MHAAAREQADPIRVLVVDDEPDFAAAIATSLERRGFLASPVFSGHDAIDRVQRAVFDVIILDLKMPELGGLETMRAVSAIDPHVQVIILTGHGTVSAGIDGMQLGASDFILKPVAVEDLCAIIRAAAERARRSRRSIREEEGVER
jgi:DNA-binding NtrC family response regulator